MGGLVSLIIAILAAIAYYGTGHPFLFWLCVILSIASLWIWGIMHNFAMDSAKAKRDNLLKYMVGEGRSPKEIERLDTSPIRISKSDINTVPNWLSWMSMTLTAIGVVLLIVRIGGYYTQKPGAKLKQPPIVMEEKAPMPMPANDGRFVTYSNGTVQDTQTNLMWAAKDNGSDINWSNAKEYCENYRGGGYTDWRMPTQDELADLYDPSVKGKSIFSLTNLITLTNCCPWASETRGSDAAYFNFFHGTRYALPWSFSGDYRALPVRSVK